MDETELNPNADFVFSEDLLSLRDCPPEAVFSRASFKTHTDPTKDELSEAEKNWVTLKAIDPANPTPPPTKFAERLLKSQLDQYAFAMPASREAWQNFCMYKYFELANDPDPKISKPAVDSLAKTSIVGLMSDRTEININTKSTEELEGTLLNKIAQIMNRGKYAHSEADVVDAEYTER